MSVLDGRLERAVIEAVKGAGELLLGMDAVHEIRAKNRTDFVTDVDMAVQARLSRELASLAPEVQFMGEERDNSDIDPARPFWILDPVDGTTNLIRRLRRSAVSLALAEGGRTVLGVVYNPYAPELYTARRGGGAYLNGRRIAVSGVEALSEGLVSAGTAPGHREWADTVFREMRSLFDTCLDIRRGGCASIDLCDVACGRVDAYVERYLCPWDYAAGALIVEEAGGRVTDFSGGALSLTEGGGVVSSNGAVHRELLALMSRAE